LGPIYSNYLYPCFSAIKVDIFVENMYMYAWICYTVYIAYLSKHAVLRIVKDL
jgi:hypothetical protein